MKKKLLESLRQSKTKKADRMAALNALATTETRDLTPAEKLEFDTLKGEAEELAATITEIEQELAATPAPIVTPPAPAPDNTAALAAAVEGERVRSNTIRERLNAARLPADVVSALEKDLLASSVTVEVASSRIFTEMAKHSAAQPETRGGLPVGGGDPVIQVQTMARELIQRDGLTKERATVQVLNANPKLYDQYLKANPAQTGARQ